MALLDFVPFFSNSHLLLLIYSTFHFLLFYSVATTSGYSQSLAFLFGESDLPH